MSRKILLLIVGIIIVLTGFGIIYGLYGYTYAVEGTVTNIATKNPIEGVKLRIGSVEDTTDKNGNYKIQGIKICQRKDLTVETPEEYVEIEPIKIDYNDRNVNKDFVLEPTLKQMVNLILEASINSQHDYLWDFMYPDDRKYWNNRNIYTKTFKKIAEINNRIGYTVESKKIADNIRTLKTWKHTVTGKKYHNVVEVPTKVIVIENGKKQPRRELEYYKKIDGFFHYFTSTNKKEAKEYINYYADYLK